MEMVNISHNQDGTVGKNILLASSLAWIRKEGIGDQEDRHFRKGHSFPAIIKFHFATKLEIRIARNQHSLTLAAFTGAGLQESERNFSENT